MGIIAGIIKIIKAIIDIFAK
ncbi:phenol-soluble modulin PSM-alpha-4 [Staphylococcus aureus]|nr:phenol-soluble modulin PSM-alpha-4 [Staphylococcus aureus]HCV4761811.1 phenol-soluble modulin PSM-alpha-4 [Staphylococcus aureus]